MAFCSECGQKIEEGAKFCPGCGKALKSTNDMSKRQQEFAGKIIKCPNCGENLNSFDTVCPSCGYELRGSNSTGSIKEFEMQIRRIEASRKEQKSGIGKAFVKAFGGNTINNTDQQIANLVSNFPVPNTKEDIFEFMILAASNIDPVAFDTSNNGYSLADRDSKKLVANAWISKYNQVYQKAQMMFPNDPKLNEITKLYKSKQREIRGNKSKVWKILIGAVALYAVLMIVIFAMAGKEEKKSDKIEAELNAIVIEIQDDISDGKYDEALIKANSLYFDRSISHTKADQWDERRENLIESIEKARNGN